MVANNKKITKALKKNEITLLGIVEAENLVFLLKSLQKTLTFNFLFHYKVLNDFTTFM